ncbi:M64 family metallopeptidase [Chryseobacterium salipaludis]|uniref:M64 family metallopeptidase n=1 Tax=Chryseobacterium TaxID=59732 RepID=UPI001FF397C3|nr:MULTISPECIES: M64 family metallopeptidase [Chryseobacterium]MCJ8498147.1 M64 family metallopeptidase [Chryseobacterium salipaludis]MCX3296655.1 M64 family metallopeptidase [Planobacterium sp. JC490]
MNQLQFDINKNFNLHTYGWGQAQLQDITKLLDGVIIEFYANLDIRQITGKPVYVLNSKNKVPPTDYPEIIKLDKFNLIYLGTSDRLWSQYSYQFAHELCHHVIDSDFYTTNDKFGWFEEALCELASIFSIDKMSQTWLTNPPYANWKDYSMSLANYITDIIGKPENKISKPFKIWLTENLDELFIDRYKRTENRIVALQLFPLFKKRPEFWTTIQYLKFIKVTNEMSFDNFIDAWTKLVPDKLKELVTEIKTTLNEEKASS